MLTRAKRLVSGGTENYREYHIAQVGKLIISSERRAAVTWQTLDKDGNDICYAITASTAAKILKGVRAEMQEKY